MNRVPECIRGSTMNRIDLQNGLCSNRKMIRWNIAQDWIQTIPQLNHELSHLYIKKPGRGMTDIMEVTPIVR